MNICYYGCGREATHQFDNGRWCCEDSFHRCPAERERRKQRMLKRFHDSLKQRMQREIEAGLHRCTYCGELAKYWLSRSNFCCKEKVSQCPEYSNWLSRKHILKYQEKPELIEKMSEMMKEVQNREDVKEAKRLKMLHLHNDDCDECKDFQKKFLKGHKDRRGPNYEKWLKYRKETNGPDNSST